MSDLEQPAREVTPENRSSRPLGVLLLVSVAVLGGGGYLLWRFMTPPPLPKGISQEDYRNAELRVESVYRRNADRSDVLSLLAEMAVEQDQLETALECFREIPTEDHRYGLSARLQEGQVFARLNRARDAEASFREFLKRAATASSAPAEHVRTAYKWLNYLLSVELRLEERKTILLEMHTAGLADVNDSKQLYFPHLLIWHTDTGRHPLTQYLKQSPDDAGLQTALSRYQVYDGEFDEARSWLEQRLADQPDDLLATSVLLECHFEASDWDAFSRVAATLPEPRGDEPWALTRMRAELALHNERWEEAVDLFDQLLKADPANPWSHMGLARAYQELGRTEDQQREQKISLVLARIRVGLHNVNEQDAEASRKLAADCDKIGFPDAAHTFREHAQWIEQPPSIQNSAPALQL